MKIRKDFSGNVDYFHVPIRFDGLSTDCPPDFVVSMGSCFGEIAEESSFHLLFVRRWPGNLLSKFLSIRHLDLLWWHLS